MIKKYGYKYVLALISIFFVSFMWPIAWFLIYMFKDEKDELKAKLVNKLEIISYVWIVLQLLAVAFKIISNVM